MFNTPLTVIQAPSGRYIYVGKVPVALGYEAEANRADIMGMRTHTGADGKPKVWKFPSFDSEAAAIEYARSFGYAAAVPQPAKA